MSAAEPEAAGRPRLFVVADVGGPGHYHLGDEAMLEANLARFRQLVPGIRFTVLSADPAWTRACYDVDAIDRPPERAHGNGAAPAAPGTAWLGDEISASLRSAQGLVISGGGNLCQTWPEKIDERVALIELARTHAVPAVVLGQSLGPALTADQHLQLRSALGWPRWIGVRGEASAEVARSLGVPAERLHQQLDDAFFLEPKSVEDERMRLLRAQPPPWLLVTLDASFGSPEHGPALRMIASQLDALAGWLDATLLFVPHVGGTKVAPSQADGVVGRALGALVRARYLELDLWPPREVRWLVAQAAMVVSTRYHPLVFASAAGIPSLGIHTDAYTRTKLRGALAPAGLESWCLSVATAARGSLLPQAMELWHRREDVRRRLSRVRAEAWAPELRRWQEICLALQLEPQAMPPRPATPTLPRATAPAIVDRTDSSADKLADRIARKIDEDRWRQYERDGYLRLGPMLDPSALSALRQRMDGIMLGQVRYPGLQMQIDTGGAYEDLPEAGAGLAEGTLGYRKVQGLEADPLVLDLLRRELFREICARHYGPHASISLFRAMLMNKPAGQGTYLPWHQDAGDVWKLDRDPLVTVWIALDEATRENGCVQVIPGSHRPGLLSRQGSTLSREHVQRHCPQDAIVHLEVAAGEAILLHNWLVHRSDVNHTDAPRRALTACYMDGRTLNTLTGHRFPTIFGEPEEAEAALPYLNVMKEENRQLRSMAAEAERYAKSLLQDNQRREEMRRAAEQYALSLEAELTRLRATQPSRDKEDR